MPKGQHNRKLTDAQRAEIVQRYTAPLPNGTWVGSKILAADYGVTENAIQWNLKRQGVTLRTVKEAHAHGKRCKPITRLPQGPPRPCMCGCGQPTEWDRKKLRWRWFCPDHEHNRLFQDRDWLYNQYATQHKGVKELAQMCRTTRHTILRYLHTFGIPVRDIRDAQIGRQAGPHNPAWKGGVSPERQRLYNEGNWRGFVKEIYKRDNYTCQRCGSGKQQRRGLHAHHVRPWADVPELRFDPANLVTLCRPCHEWVHSTANEAREFLA